ncbi:hypothetical protein [Geodermatophilus poikilotrophus]|nr:hypothetical protein [Geodermatophilus poikilotrophus]
MTVIALLAEAATSAVAADATPVDGKATVRLAWWTSSNPRS